MLDRTLTSIAIATVTVTLVACSAKDVADPRNEAPLVKISMVNEASPPSRTFSGVVVARTQSDLGFRVPGKIIERLVDAGQIVKKGQPLMRMDPIDLGLQAHAQHESMLAASARAKQAVDDEVRYRDLVAAGAVSASTYDQVKAAADAAKAQLAAVAAQANVAENAESYSILAADSDGVVMDTLAEPGQVVGAGQTVIRLARAGSREALIQLPETLRPQIGSTAKVTLYSGGASGVQAKLRVLSHSADKVTRTFEARYVLEDSLKDAPLGSTISVEIPNQEPANSQLRIPLGALLDTGKATGVWTVDGSPAKLKWRTVQVVAVGSEEARVTGSLRPGEKIVSLGAYALHDGESVRVAGRLENAAGGAP